MRRSGLALVVVVLVSAFASTWSPQTQSTAAIVRNNASAAVAPINSRGTGSEQAKIPKEPFRAKIREKIRTFFSRAWRPETECEDAVHYCVPQNPRTNIRFVIAIVPDPYHSHLGHFFDSAIEAIEQGAFNEGYAFDRSIMPWPYTVESAAGSGTTANIINLNTNGKVAVSVNSNSKPTISGSVKQVSEVPQESLPGLMIFRENEIRLNARYTTAPNPDFNPLAEPLFVFVVGETPTAGINEDQYRIAVEIIRAIGNGAVLPKTSSVVRKMKGRIAPRAVQPKTQDTLPEFGVLGPTFSGSLFSLRSLLQDKGNARVLPVYGTVMSTSTINWFNTVKPDRVQMSLFQQDSGNALQALKDFAVDVLKYQARDIAVLAEDETAYGSTFSQQNPTIKPKGLNANPSSQDKEIYLFFPRGISQLRSEYSKETPTQLSSGNSEPQPNLRLDLEITGSDDDSVAPYAKPQTAVNQEALMRAIVSELHRLESKFILLRASDPLDELFLANYLHDKYPQARLVVPTPDLLFARESNAPLSGVLGLSTYPLEPAPFNPRCVGFASGDEIFGASHDVALYNATTALIQELGRFRGDPLDSPLPKGEKSTENGTKQRADRYPCNLSSDMWLTAVSGNAIRPIKVLPLNLSSTFFPEANKDLGKVSNKVPNEHEDPSKVQRDARDPLTWVFAYLLCLAVMFLHGWSSWTGGDFRMWDTAGQTDSDKKLQKKAWVLWLGGLTLVAILVVLISPWVPITQSEGQGHGEWEKLLFWIPLLFFVVFISKDFWSVRKEPELSVSFAVISAAIAGMGIAYAMCTGPSMVLWRQRIIDLTSGTSSAMPLLFLLVAFYGWFVYTFRAEALIDQRGPKLPPDQKLPTTYYNLRDETAEDIRISIHPGSVPWVAAASVVAILCIALPPLVLARGLPPVRSLEGLFFDGVYCVLLAGAIVMLIGTLLRLLELWWRFRVLLTSMDRVGLKDAILRLKGFEWNIIWNPALSVANEEHKLIFREIQILECLLEEIVKDSEGKHAALKTAIQTILDRRTKIISIIRKSPQATDLWTFLTFQKNYFDKHRVSSNPSESQIDTNLMQDYITLQKEFAETAGSLLNSYLNEQWRKSCLTDSGADGGTAEGLSEISIKPEIATATIRIIPKVEAPSGTALQSKNAVRLAEDFVASVYANFLVTVLLSIRAMVLTAITAYVCIVLSTVFYPFAPAPTLTILALALFAFTGAIILYVYEEMHRDATLSRMTSTEPGKLDSAFWMKFLSAGLVPLLTLMASVFPQAGHLLYTLVEPILQALH